nr:hypothetical protein HMPREF0276_0216 [Corynebacterium accolens ATCC 49725]
MPPAPPLAPYTASHLPPPFTSAPPLALTSAGRGVPFSPLGERDGVWARPPRSQKPKMGIGKRGR